MPSGSSRVSNASPMVVSCRSWLRESGSSTCSRTVATCPGAAATTPAAVSFLDLTVMGGEDVVQQVRVTDHAGAVWLAYYAMQRQKDGRWRANGCHLVQPVKTVPT